MKDDSPEYKSEEERLIDEAALDWLIKEDQGLTPEEQDAFFDWMAADPRHSEWYCLRKQNWKQFDSLVEWRPEHSEEPNPDLLAVHWHESKWFRGTLAASIAACLLIALSLWLSIGRSSDIQNGYLPDVGSMAHTYEIHRLSDGSVIELNKGAQIFIDFDANERRLQLLSGEAFFNVAKNPGRPFIVNARGVDIQAIGTAFSVNLEEESLEVLVTHGRVSVNPLTKTESEADTDSWESLQSTPELTAGQRSYVSFSEFAEEPLVEDINEEDLDVKLAWKHRVLAFENQPLSEIVAEFNKYHPAQLRILDREAADMYMTATFRSSNLDGFLRLLELTMPVAVERGDTDITIQLKDN